MLPFSRLNLHPLVQKCLVLIGTSKVLVASFLFASSYEFGVLFFLFSQMNKKNNLVFHPSLNMPFASHKALAQTLFMHKLWFFFLI